MSASEKKSLAAQARKSPAKTALLVLIVGVTAFIWKGVLFADSKSAPSAAPATTASAPQAAPQADGGATAPTSPAPETRRPVAALLGPILSYDQAMTRIRAWRKPLKLHDDGKDDWVEVDLPEPVVEEQAAEEEPVSLVLRGVAIIGRKRYAQFEQGRFEEGQRIGPYIIQRISRNRVDLQEGKQILTLRVTDPTLPGTPVDSVKDRVDNP